MPSQRREDPSEDLRVAISDLSKLADGIETNDPLTPDQVRTLARGLTAALAAAASSLGECQKMVPYSPIRPVIPPGGGLFWCCNHDPEHCERNIS